MKICPQCERKFPDERTKFCLDDGTALIQELDATVLSLPGEPTLSLPGNPKASAERSAESANIPEATMPAIDLPARAPSVPTQDYSRQPVVPAEEYSPQPAAPSRDYARSERRSSGVIWIAGAIIIAGAAIAAALFVTRKGGDNTQPTNQQVAAASPAATEAIAGTTPAGTTAPDVNLPTPTRSPTQQKPTPSPAKPVDRPTPAVIPQPTPRPTPRSTPRAPVSGGVLNGKATYLAKPAYPAIARSAHASGAVNVQVLIDESGNVISANAVSGHPLLKASAVAAARSSRFRPTLLSGQPVKVTGVIVYNFVAQ
jgi:TonB family protein